MNPERTMTKSDLIDYASKMYNQNKHYYDVSTTKRRLRLTLNNIYTVNKYFFIDISLLNKTNIQFDIDQIKFSIEDKKVFRKTNVQSVEIKPIASFNDDMNFKRTYRNIFVFEKFTFPGDKMFTIEISEKQISGRTIILRISYADVLAADSFNIK
jgi:conjugative transposon TraN protein